MLIFKRAYFFHLKAAHLQTIPNWLTEHGLNPQCYSLHIYPNEGKYPLGYLRVSSNISGSFLHPYVDIYYANVSITNTLLLDTCA